ncbi:hypothetical protein Tco_0007279 [Tanacetum coccineum]
MIDTWDLLKKESIWQYCSPYKTANKLEEIRNFKQDMYETLYQAWESPDNIDDIQERFKEAHFTKECPLKKEDEAVEQSEKRTTMGKGNMKDPVPRDLPPTPFQGHLKEHIVYITPPDDDYVAPTTSPTLDKQLNRFGMECFGITRVAEKANGNHVEDVQELSDIKTNDYETFIWKLLHQWQV